MKIVLNDGTELSVNNITRSIGGNVVANGTAETAVISFSKSVLLEDVVDKLNSETIKSFKLIRPELGDKTFEGYEIQSISENSTSDGTTVSAFLVK